MIPISPELTGRISQEALSSPRRRKNFNFHREYSDPLQRLLNIIEPFSYIQPHKHENPDKVEAFVVLKGRLLVVEFCPDGLIADFLLVDPSTGTYGAEIPPRTFHSIFSLESGTIVYEVKNGPYSPHDDKNFAVWAPKEGDPGTENYIRNIFMQCRIDPETPGNC
jgi:cupin fold WbuC family metalloprotein